jgi:hypothetical protein
VEAEEEDEEEGVEDLREAKWTVILRARQSVATRVPAHYIRISLQ